MRHPQILLALASTTLFLGACSAAPAGPWETTPPPSDETPPFEQTSRGAATAESPRLDSARRVDGGIVELRGKGFGAGLASSLDNVERSAAGKVTLDGLPISFVSWSDEVVRIAIPSIDAGNHALRLVVNGQETNAVQWIAGQPTFACQHDEQAQDYVDPGIRPLPAYVSVTFDGGFRAHGNAAILDTLERLQMRATFFVNSGFIGAGAEDAKHDRLDAAGIAAIAARGHEIAGSTVFGDDLFHLDPDAAREEICKSRDALVGLGYRTVSFAYPFGHASDGLEAIVKSCGYLGARTGTSNAHPFVPTSAYAISSVAPFSCDDGLSEMKQRLQQTEALGGTTAIVFSDICDEDCSQTSTRTSDVVAFLTWLKSRQARGTFVRTMGEIVANTH